MNTFYGENQENNIKMIKNNMTLDFNSANNNNKKAKLMRSICVLESPDLKLLKVASPELERMIIQQNGSVTTTPTPSAALPYFLKQENEVTEEQEMYVRPFVDALNQLHQNNGQQNQCLNENHNNSDKTNDNQRNSNSVSDGTTVTKFAVPQRPHIPSTHLTNNCSANKSSDDCSESYSSVNECPALVNSDNSNKVLPPYSQSVTNNNSSIAQPIDMEDQERIKLERKRLRNRIAASKCRRRKLERISKLEDKVKGLKGENSELYIVVSKLRDQVCSLKQQVMDHVKFGCQISMSQ